MLLVVSTHKKLWKCRERSDEVVKRIYWNQKVPSAPGTIKILILIRTKLQFSFLTFYRQRTKFSENCNTTYISHFFIQKLNDKRPDYLYTDTSSLSRNGIRWMRGVHFHAAMTHVFGHASPRFRRTRDFKRWCARVCGKTRKKKKKVGKAKRERKLALCAQQRGRGVGGGRPIGRRNHKSVKMFCNFEIRRACWFALKRVTGNRQPAGCGRHRHSPQKRIAVPPGNTH